MRYVLLSLILLLGCSPPPPSIEDLMADPHLLRTMSGRQWLAYDLEDKRAIALALRDKLVAEAQALRDETNEYLIAQFQMGDQRLQQYECVDQPQEVCDRDKATQADRLTMLCEFVGADECTEAGLSSAAIALAELKSQERIDQYNCALQLEMLDLAARQKSTERLPWPMGVTFWWIALESCGWRPPDNYLLE